MPLDLRPYRQQVPRKAGEKGVDDDSGTAAAATEEDDSNEEEQQAADTLAEVLAAARALIERAMPGQTPAKALAALRRRIGRLPRDEAHAALMACGSMLASRWAAKIQCFLS
jgi:hypothetical protein